MEPLNTCPHAGKNLSFLHFLTALAVNRDLCHERSKRATKLYFMHYSCLVIIFYSTGL